MVDKTLRNLFHDLGLRIRERQQEERWMREGIGYVQCMSKLLKNLNLNQFNQEIQTKIIFNSQILKQKGKKQKQ